MPSFLRALAFVLVAGLVLGTDPAAAQSTDLVDLRNSALALQRDAQNLDRAIGQQAEENARIAAQLNAPEAADPVTFEAAEAAVAGSEGGADPSGGEGEAPSEDAPATEEPADTPPAG